MGCWHILNIQHLFFCWALAVCLKCEFELLGINKYLGMSCYVSLQLIFPWISSVFCNLPCRRNTLASFKTVLYLHKISIFLTLVRKVCRKQSPAETWIELQGSNSVGGGGAVCTALTLYRALPLLTGYSDVCIYLRRQKVTDRPWPFPKSTQASVTEEETGPQCVRLVSGWLLHALLTELMKARWDFPLL